MVLLRWLRDLPVGLKLATSVVGALLLLGGLSWFSLDRLELVAGLEGVVAEQATVAEDIAASLVAAQDLRVASREVELQQTSGAVKASLQ
ncbi:MAG TPA: hypothetical protein VFG62_18860, partial [Rhodopila sp.]|nr:hypothetical protein [Rhodopila sp.]